MTASLVVPLGGAQIGGTAPIGFQPGPQGTNVDADVVVEWDLDNDGDFDGTHENITSFVVALQTMVGRDFPSHLTGKSGPGQLQLTLRNDDDRFSYFNAASPLNQNGNNLKVGRKIRLRTLGSANPDPALLAKDRFLNKGLLAVDEMGNAWTLRTTPVFTQQADSSGATMAVPLTKGATASASIHIATVNVGQNNFYLQTRWRFLDRDNAVGMVYRFQDTSNYGIVYAKQISGFGTLVLAQVSAGSLTTTTTIDVELRPDDFLGVNVQSTTATIYHNGVPVGSGTAFSNGANNVGLYSDWRIQRPGSIQEFYAWATVPAETEGIIWTGDITEVRPSVTVDLDKTVEVKAEGRLARPAGQDVSPPNSLGITDNSIANGFASPGSRTGVMVGGTLGRVGMLHPPGLIDKGDVILGSVGLDTGKALDIMRQFEEAELGFIHEAPEGWINYDSRGARALQPRTGIWGDAQVGGVQFEYESIELLDWRREIVNRVEAGVSPKLPFVKGFQGENTANPDIIIPMPDETNGAAVGDLFLIIIASSHGTSGLAWEKPVGWTDYRDAGDNVGRLRIYAKVVEQDDINDDVTFYDSAVNGDFTSWNILVKDFYGDLQQGLVVSDVTGFGGSSVAQARLGRNNPAAVFPGWAPDPSAVLCIRAGMTGGAVDNDENEDDFFAPNGFSDTSSAASATLDTGMNLAFLNTNDKVIDPSPFTNNATAGAAFEEYDFVETVTIAIRGFAGNPPETQGGQTVQVDDFDSQEDHNAIRTHVNPSRLFATIEDATTYAETVLASFADDRPIFRIGFTATRSANYRQQAYRRRVGDKIRLVANNGTGMGVNADFIIEQVVHRISDGGKLWTVNWELSPA